MWLWVEALVRVVTGQIRVSDGELSDRRVGNGPR
jgi:hypothetical protein